MLWRRVVLSPWFRKCLSSHSGAQGDVQGGPAGEIELIVKVALRSFFEVEDFVDFLVHRQAAGQLATAAFTRVWDNHADADYDRL
jgi:hypothetical protein